MSPSTTTSPSASLFFSSSQIISADTSYAANTLWDMTGVGAWSSLPHKSATTIKTNDISRSFSISSNTSSCLSPTAIRHSASLSPTPSMKYDLLRDKDRDRDRDSRGRGSTLSSKSSMEDLVTSYFTVINPTGTGGACRGSPLVSTKQSNLSPGRSHSSTFIRKSGSKDYYICGNMSGSTSENRLERWPRHSIILDKSPSPRPASPPVGSSGVSQTSSSSSTGHTISPSLINPLVVKIVQREGSFGRSSIPERRSSLLVPPASPMPHLWKLGPPQRENSRGIAVSEVLLFLPLSAFKNMQKPLLPARLSDPNEIERKELKDEEIKRLREIGKDSKKESSEMDREREKLKSFSTSIPVLTKKVKKITENSNLLNRAAFWLSRDNSQMGMGMGLGASSMGLGGSMLNLPDGNSSGSVSTSDSGEQSPLSMMMNSMEMSTRRSNTTLSHQQSTEKRGSEQVGGISASPLASLRLSSMNRLHPSFSAPITPRPSSAGQIPPNPLPISYPFSPRLNSPRPLVPLPFCPTPLSAKQPVEGEASRRLSRTVKIDFGLLTSSLSPFPSPSALSTPKASQLLFPLPPPLSLSLQPSPSLSPFSPSSSSSSLPFYISSSISPKAPRKRLSALLRTSSDENRSAVKSNLQSQSQSQSQSIRRNWSSSSEKMPDSRVVEDPSRPHNVPPLSLDSIPQDTVTLSSRAPPSPFMPHSSRISSSLSLSSRNSVSSSALCSMGGPASTSNFTRSVR